MRATLMIVLLLALSALSGSCHDLDALSAGDGDEDRSGDGDQVPLLD